MLTSTNEDNRALCSSHCTECPSTLSMSIKFRDNDRADLNSLIERHSLIEASLSNAAVHHENSSIRLRGSLDLLHLIEQSRLLLMSARRVNYDDLEFLLLEKVDALLCYLHWVGLLLVTEERALDLGRIHLKLLERTGSERVRAYHAYSPALLHVVVGELGAGGGLARALQPHEHHHVGLTLLKLVGLVFGRLQHVGELLHDGALNQFSYIGEAISRSVETHLKGDLGLDRLPQLHHVLDVHIR